MGLLGISDAEFAKMQKAEREAKQKHEEAFEKVRKYEKSELRKKIKYYGFTSEELFPRNKKTAE